MINIKCIETGDVYQLSGDDETFNVTIYSDIAASLAGIMREGTYLKIHQKDLEYRIALAKRKGFTPINFSKDEFIDFLNSSTPIADLYDAWVKSGYESSLKPSVDRLDDYQGYSLGNIQVTTQKQNIDKYYQDAVEGKNTKTAVSVLQYTLDNQFVKEHHSISEAARSVGSTPTNIRLAAINYEIKRKNPDGSYRTDKRKHCRGFKWKLKTP